MGVPDALRLLGANADSGLADAEAVRRLSANGYNDVPEKKDNPLARFLSKFWGLSAWLMEAIIILSYWTGRYSDLAIVAALLVLNAVISFLQERNAAQAVEALKRKLQVSARVRRGGAWKGVPARELVAGDLVRVRIGDFVPADIKILSGNVAADQSSLTGESAAISKKPEDLLYSGSIIASGECTGLVVRTGIRTYFGRTVQLVQTAAPKLHIEEVISKVVRALLGVTLLVLAAILLISILQGHDLLPLLPLMLVLLLGAVPVALPAMFTVSMALGARELVKRDVLVTRLSAPDDAASMDVLCVDKTGTLTMNKATIAHLMPWKGHTEDDVALCGALSSNEANHDAIDMAFIEKARQGRLPIAICKQERFVPFDPKTRRTEATVLCKGRRFKVMKGSIQAIANACSIHGAARVKLDEYAADCARSGYRALAVCRSDSGRKPVLVGVAALHDPPRPESTRIVERLRDLGVAVKMLTGDAMPVARQIGAQVGIGTQAVTGAELEAAGAKNEKAREAGSRASSTQAASFGRISSVQASLAEQSDIFAEIYPEDKYLLVRDLQARGHIVGMTGDGVNDAPALRQAEVGIALSSATDAAKGAASIVLTREGLAGVLEPIRTGRMMFARISTWILNKITKTFLQVGFITVAFLATGQYVISASAMILLIFMIDFVTISLSTDNVQGSSKPSVWDVGGLVKAAAVMGALLVVEACALLFAGLNYLHLSAGALNTFSFTILFYFTAFLILTVRERARFWKSSPSRTLLAIVLADMALAAVLASAGLLGLQAIPLELILLVIGYCMVFSLLLNDWVKTRLLGANGVMNKQ